MPRFEGREIESFGERKRCGLEAGNRIWELSPGKQPIINRSSLHYRIIPEEYSRNIIGIFKEYPEKVHRISREH
ncbi:hypothetical protein FTO70_01515 [Methanosarcina sp. KYL-1]|uniref:hypothetical protein n=1 Tax=Methanosarcina sp. KYL-1 TaxID=2602068 RepID=UPI002101389E|nr:hypothetical protein [Methanosarcina sp. KYL-1]MCQ1534395.1 hypothetical protein [Methanosarcina sp. KYL-1]